MKFCMVLDKHITIKGGYYQYILQFDKNKILAALSSYKLQSLVSIISESVSYFESSEAVKSCLLKFNTHT